MTEPSFISAEVDEEVVRETAGEEEVDVREMREELISFSEKGQVKQSEKTLKKASAQEIQKIYKKFKIAQLDKANDVLLSTFITEFTKLLRDVGAIDAPEELSKDLADNNLLKDDLKNLFGLVTPYIPLIGIITAGVTIGSYVIKKKMEKVEEVQEE